MLPHHLIQVSRYGVVQHGTLYVVSEVFIFIAKGKLHVLGN